MHRVSIMNPLPSLPRSLIPDLNKQWKPPVLYYGWSIGDLLPKLLQFAEEHNLNVYTHTAIVPEPAPVWDNSDPAVVALRGCLWTEDDEDEEEEEEDELVVREFESAQNALWAMAREAGVDVSHLRYWDRPFRFQGVLHDPPSLAISLYSNYELERATPEEDIEKVQKYIGIQEKPAWYVSNLNPEWQVFTPEW